MTRRMTTRIGVAATLMLLATACGGDDSATGGTTASTTASPSTTTAAPPTTAPATTTTAVPDGFTITSEDGDITIEVPAGAIAADPGISIRVLQPEEYPEAFAEARELPGTVLYSMEPDGLTLAAPVRVTRRIPVANFGGLGASEVPFVSLVTTTADGAGFEQLADARILRSGDSIFVSGETTHFSPLAGLSQQVTIEVRFLEISTDAARELGVDWQMDLLFRDAAGNSLTAPGVTATGADSDLETVIEGPSILGKCANDGTFDSQFRWDIEAAPPSVTDPTILALRVSPVLTGPERIELEFGVGIDIGVVCAPRTPAIVGLPLPGDFLVDHPGGQTIIPDEAFRGGLSGLLGQVVLPTFAQPIHGGLIRDDNGNGVVDGTDTIYPPVAAEPDGTYIYPLFGFGTYFAWFGTEVPGMHDVLDGPVPVLEGIPLLGDLFESAAAAAGGIAVFGADGLPIPITVGPGEGSGGGSDAGELLILLTPQLLDGADG